ncbi:MAG: carboxypeptidase regulatory-like domain-containing protein [Anaerolineae bacterium]
MALAGTIAFETNRGGTFDIYAQPADGNSPAVPLVTTTGDDFTPVWSPDGTQFVFASDQDGDFDIYLRTADGQVVNLTRNTAHDAHSSWSPGGDRIIFASDRGGTYFQLYTMRLDGMDVQRVGVVPDNNAAYPRYSPDGSKIAFMRASTMAPLCQWNWDVWVMDANGDNQRRVTTALGADIYPDWTPDGREIIYASCRNLLDFDLYAVNPDTLAERQLTSWFLWNEWGPTFSPDGEHIAFNTDIDGDTEIYIVPAAGGTAANLTQNSADDLMPGWTQPEGSGGSYSISGSVRDQNGNPIPDVSISAGSGHTTSTDSNGDYTLSGLPAGTYTLMPGKIGHVFSPASLFVAVPPDATGKDFIGTSMSSLRLTISLEVSQAIQCLNNPDCFGQAHRDWCSEGDCENAVPLVRGKSTWVRAYVRCDSNCGSVDRVLGWITSSTHPNKSHSSFGPASIGQPGNIEALRTDLGRTLNFILPPGWEGGNDEDPETVVDFTVEVYAHDSTGRGYTLSRRVFPGFRFQKRRPLDIRYVSVGYQPSEDRRDLPAANIIDNAHSRLLQRIFPTAEISYRPLYTDVVNINVRPLVYESAEYEKLVAQLESIRTSIADRPDLMFGWLPFNVTIQGTGGATWYGVGQGKRTPLGTANRVAFRTVAHEVGHELGLGHAPCEVTAGANWPYGSDGTIQEYGLDLTSLTLLSETAPDFMSYCGEGFSEDAGPERSWISPYHYMELFDSDFLRSDHQVAQQLSPQDLLLVSGLVYLDGRVEFFPFYHIQTTPSVPSAGSGYCLEFQGSAGESLASYCFNLSFVEEHLGQPTDIEHFVWALPYPVGVTRLTLKQGTSVLGQVQVSAHAPEISITSPKSGQSWSGTQTVTWMAGDADNDQLSFRVFYSPDDGRSWVPLSADLIENRYVVDTDWLAGGDQARIRVIASDGINTGTAEVESLDVTRKGPRVSIVAPEDGYQIRPGDPLVLWSHAYDLEDGALPNNALSWSSDLQGALGSGPELVVSDLLRGVHRITLTGRDSDANVTRDSASVFVGYRIYIPVILNNYSGLHGR